MTHSPPQLAYVFLLCALLSLGGLGILHKVADRHKCRASAISFLLFLWATLLVGLGYSTIRHIKGGGLSIPPVVVLVAAVCGAFASIAILAFQAGLRHGEIATSWLIINLSTAVPTAFSIALYKEEVGLRRGISLMLATLALVLLWQDWKKQKAARIRPVPGGRTGYHQAKREVD
jgi:drug/metabolite transporter (DMT)-like permease